MIDRKHPTTMPVAGNITPKARRCLENMLVSGPITALELNALDPTAPDHRQTIKTLEQAKYVVAGPKPDNGSALCTYSLTRKAKHLLGAAIAAPADDDTGTATLERTPRGSYAPRRRRPAANPTDTTVAGPISHGSMSTKGHYHPCKDMLAPAIRPGAEDALSLPSRVGDQLHYRDGRVAHITAQHSEPIHD
ncbi:MAG: hypothetical protein H7293_09005 [Candidatus Saccharibacteria bacterium]|nr:hypothetical protein [Rhodoferax sp.]